MEPQNETSPETKRRRPTNKSRRFLSGIMTGGRRRALSDKKDKDHEETSRSNTVGFRWKRKQTPPDPQHYLDAYVSYFRIRWHACVVHAVFARPENKFRRRRNMGSNKKTHANEVAIKCRNLREKWSGVAAPMFRSCGASAQWRTLAPWMRTYFSLLYRSWIVGSFEIYMANSKKGLVTWDFILRQMKEKWC